MKNLLYISLHKFYNKKRNLLKTVALRVKGILTPSSPPNPPKTKLIQTRHCFCGGEGPLGHNLVKVMAFYLYATLLTMSVLPDTSNTRFVNVVYFFGLIWYHISCYGRRKETPQI